KGEYSYGLRQCTGRPACRAPLDDVNSCPGRARRSVGRDRRRFGRILLILDAAATGDPTLAAVERILRPINGQLQEFKAWFHNAWHLAMEGPIVNPASTPVCGSQGFQKCSEAERFTVQENAAGYRRHKPRPEY